MVCSGQQLDEACDVNCGVNFAGKGANACIIRSIQFLQPGWLTPADNWCMLRVEIMSWPMVLLRRRFPIRILECRDILD